MSAACHILKIAINLILKIMLSIFCFMIQKAAHRPPKLLSHCFTIPLNCIMM